jgi:hypothetical protein
MSNDISGVWVSLGEMVGFARQESLIGLVIW